MGIFDLIITAIALSMDAFAVSISKGLSTKNVKIKHGLTTGIYFGGFQMSMPLIGYLLGVRFADIIASVDHWIAFVLLGGIGINMIRESMEEEESMDASFGFRAMLPLAIATSIDALAVGVTFAFLSVSIAPAVALIGCTTFVLSLVGVAVGNFFGARYKKRAEMAGGIILVLMGCKILLEHLGIL